MLTTKAEQNMQSSGMIHSATNSIISGSVAGNHQSYSVSGSMKRENSNESGFRNQDYNRPYGNKADYHDHIYQRTRIQEEQIDQRRPMYSTKISKNAGDIPTEY